MPTINGAMNPTVNAMSVGRTKIGRYRFIAFSIRTPLLVKMASGQAFVLPAGGHHKLLF